MSAPMDELELVRALFGEPADDHLAMARARRRLRRRFRDRTERLRWLSAAAATLVAVVAGILWLPGVAPADAQRSLQRFAVVATDLDLAAGDHPVVYERFTVSRVDARTDLEHGAAYRLTVGSVREVWRAASGSFSAHERTLTVDFVSSEDRGTWEALGRPPLPEPGDVSDLSADDLPLPDLSGLPRDPRALLETVRQRWRPDRLRSDQQLLFAIGQLLARGDASPELRAALFRAAAEIPGVELLGPTRDPLDREGIGIGLGPDQRRVTLVIDQATSALLSVEGQLVLGGDLVTEWNAYSIWATVPEIGDRPSQADIV